MDECALGGSFSSPIPPWAILFGSSPLDRFQTSPDKLKFVVNNYNRCIYQRIRHNRELREKDTNLSGDEIKVSREIFDWRGAELFANISQYRIRFKISEREKKVKFNQIRKE